MENIIINKKQKFRGYTRYPDRYFKNIGIIDHLLCDVDAINAGIKVR